MALGKINRLFKDIESIEDWMAKLTTLQTLMFLFSFPLSIGLGWGLYHFWTKGDVAPSGFKMWVSFVGVGLVFCACLCGITSLGSVQEKRKEEVS